MNRTEIAAQIAKQSTERIVMLLANCEQSLERLSLIQRSKKNSFELNQKLRRKLYRQELKKRKILI
jgi:hypothetical protein